MRKVILALILASTPATAAEGELILVCEGVMRGLFTDRTGGGVVLDNRGNTAAAKGGTATYSEIPTTAEFQMNGETARLNLPQPPTCSICTGEKGWREVRDLSVDDDRITGRIRYGMFSGTKFEIDRRTGVMTSENGFRGECHAVSLQERRF